MTTATHNSESLNSADGYLNAMSMAKLVANDYTAQTGEKIAPSALMQTLGYGTK